jgi:hypothetical protein
MTTAAAAPAPTLPPAALTGARAALRAVAQPYSTVAVVMPGALELLHALKRDGFRTLPSPLLEGPVDSGPPAGAPPVTAEVWRLRVSGALYLLLPAHVAGTNEERHASTARLLGAHCPLLAQTPAATVYGLSDPRAGTIRELADSLLPEDCAVAVASSGLTSLLDLGRRRAMHFPAGPGNAYAGHEPGDCETALVQVAERAAAGVEYLVIPAFAPSWPQLTPGFLPAVRRQHREVARRPEVAFIFSLREAPDEEPAR